MDPDYIKYQIDPGQVWKAPNGCFYTIIRLAGHNRYSLLCDIRKGYWWTIIDGESGRTSWTEPQLSRKFRDEGWEEAGRFLDVYFGLAIFKDPCGEMDDVVINEPAARTEDHQT